MGEFAHGAKRWNEEETLLALYLYFQLPFGKLHSGNAEIQRLASALGRSNSSVAMKLCNFASLDPKITSSGRRGLGGTSKLDRAVYAEFGKDWTKFIARAELLWERQVQDAEPIPSRLASEKAEFHFEEYRGPSTTQTLVQQRVGQDFFRRAVLSNFEETCCITGIADPRLLVASHIKPWSKDIENRHNPTNGLLLSATLDRAFDRGLLSVDSDQRIHVSRQLLENPSLPTRKYFQQFEHMKLRPSMRFDPDPSFLHWHMSNCFINQ